MLCKVNAMVTKDVMLKPGDRVELDGLTSGFLNRPFTITRVVENRKQTYVVFNNSTWRPLSTYGKTWEKIG